MECVIGFDNACGGWKRLVCANFSPEYILQNHIELPHHLWCGYTCEYSTNKFPNSEYWTNISELMINYIALHRLVKI